jgi:hypothetical protein
VPVGALAENAATGAGLMAAAIAVTGFLTHAWPAISGKDEEDVRQATVIGGLAGFLVAVGLLIHAWML